MTKDPATPQSHIRRTVYFSGRVQGVGFRFTTEAIASRYAVTGFVRNLPDGRVEVVAEGARAEIDRFQDAIQHTMRGNIRGVDARNGPATREFSSFRITF